MKTCFAQISSEDILGEKENYCNTYNLNEVDASLNESFVVRTIKSKRARTQDEQHLFERGPLRQLRKLEKLELLQLGQLDILKEQRNLRETRIQELCSQMERSRPSHQAELAILRLRMDRENEDYLESHQSEAELLK